MQRHDYHSAPAYMRFQSVKVGIIRLGPVARSTRYEASKPVRVCGS